MKIQLLLSLLAAHVFADFVFQGAVMATWKNRHKKHPTPCPCWAVWLTAHAVVNAACVFYVTQSLGLAIAEFILHWLIDLAKCEGQLGPHRDQLLHVICKVTYWGLLL